MRPENPELKTNVMTTTEGTLRDQTHESIGTAVFLTAEYVV